MNLNNLSACIPSPNLVENSLKNRPKDNNTGSGLNTNNKSSSVYKNFHRSKTGSRSRSRSSSCSSNKSFTPISSSQSGNANIKRYTRSTLYLLRNESYARRRPECSLRCELQSLGVWKFSIANNTSISAGGSGSVSQTLNGNSNNNIPSNNGSESSITGAPLNSISSALSVNNPHSQHANSRTQRSPAVTTSYHSHIYTHSNQYPTQSSQKFNNNSSNYLDHRSISSSHLMPAFAKRRIVSSGTNISGNRTSVTQNAFTSTNQNSTTSTPASNTQSDASHNESEVSNYRHQQRRSVEIESNMSSSSYLSPQRSDADIERECGSKSPNLSTSSSTIHGRHTSLNTSLAQERRIGSGRLLPRDVTNWSDYPSLKSNDSNGGQQDYKDGNKMHSSAVDPVPSSNRNATRGRGIFDSSNTNVNANSMSVGENLIALMERRSYERRHGMTNNDEKCEREPSRYRAIGQDSNQSQQQSRHNRRQQQSHSNQYSYHNNYNDRLEEPEWFSSGPTSQHDTIELRGFDETDENYDNIGTEIYRHNDKSNSKTKPGKQNDNSLFQTTSAANLDISKNVKNKSTQPIGDAEETINADTDIDLGANVKRIAPLQNKSIISSKNSTKTSASGYDTDDSHLINSDEEQISGIHIIDTGNDSDNMQESINSFKKEGMRKTCSIQEQNTKTNTVEGFQSECDKMFNTFFQGKQTPSDTADIGVKNSIGQKDQTDIEMLDAFFKSDSLKHNLLVSTLQENSANENSAAITSSRFSRWFVNEDTNENVNKAKSSSNEISSTDNKIFHQSRAPTIENNTLLEFIQRSKLPTSLQNGAAHPNAIPSVGELEAKMRQMDVNTNKTILNNTEHSSELNTEHLAPQESQTPGEIEAFKKLLEQLGTVNKYQNQQQLSEQAHLMNHQNRKLINASGLLTQHNSQMNMIVPADSNLTNNNVSNVISNVASSMLNTQHQKDDVQKLHQEIYHQQQMPPQKHVVHTKEPQVDVHPLTTNESTTAQNPLPSLHMPQFTTYLQSKRLDSQHLLQCVARGEIAVSFLEQELNNPNINPQVREIITSVLRKNASRIIASNQPITDTTATDGMSTSSASNIMQVLPHHIQQQYSSILYSQSNTFGTHLTSNVILPNPMVISSTHASTTQQKLQQQGIANSRDPGFNTQTLIQTAAIKKKIDEHQHETLKKQQQQSHLLINQYDSQLKNVPQPLQQVQLQTQQHQRHLNSPTPLAFTPTSVLRKMTADKENTTGSSSSSHISLGAATNNLHQPISSKQQNTQTQQQLSQTIYLGQPHQAPNTFSVSQPRMILGVGSGAQHMQHQNSNNSQSPQHKEFLSGTQQQLRNTSQQQMKWPCTSTHQMVINQMLPPTNIKPLGRPILKGSTSSTQQPQQSLPVQTTVSAPQTAFANKIDIQQLNQQHKLKHNITPQRMVNHHSHLQQAQQQQQQQAFSPPKAHIPPTQQQLYQHQQQLRVLAFQRPQHFQQQLHHRPNHQQYDTANRSLCPIIVGGNGNACSVNNINSTTTGTSVSSSVGGAGTGIIDYQREGGLSPTSNQLAQWFSPELLAQASAGKLPLLNMNQALSLEEFERSIQQHSSTTVVQN